MGGPAKVSSSTAAKRVWFVCLVGLVCLALAGATSGCEETDAGMTPIAEATLPPLRLDDHTTDLFVTWIDERGETHTGTALSDVPEGARGEVRIVTRTAGHGALFYVADLTKKNEDGSYSVQATPAHQWEKRIADRRDAYRKKHAPPPAPKASASEKPEPGPVAGISAVVYGAVWCGPCHDAENYLKSRGVNVAYFDIEKEPARAREMQHKLRSAGKSGGTIPVIDINGMILQGFSKRAIDAALQKAGRTMKL